MTRLLQFLRKHGQCEHLHRRSWLAGCSRSAPFIALIVAACSRLESADDLFGDAAAGRGGTGAGSSSIGNALGGVQVSRGEAGGPSRNVAVGGQSSATGTCWNASGQQGLGCYRCSPQNFLELEQACTDAQCIPFDNSKILTKLSTESRLPGLPNPAGATGSTPGSSTPDEFDSPS